MSFSRLFSPVRAFAAFAFAGAVSVTLPGLAAAQGWDWDEDVAPTLDTSADLTDCADDGVQLESWINQLLVGEAQPSPNGECSAEVIWS